MTEEDLFNIAYLGINSNIKSASYLKIRYTASLNAYLKITNDNIILIGQTDNPTSFSFTNTDSQSFALKLPIGSIKRIFDIPANEITGYAIPLCDIKSSLKEEQILNEINKHNNIFFKTQVIDKIINTREEDSLINSIIKKIINESTYTVKDLSSKTGYSNRQLQRIMLYHTGFTPKIFLNILRFEKSKSMIEKCLKQYDLSSITYESGYFDQSHMIKDFVRFSGLSPKSYKNHMSDFYNTISNFYVKLNTINP